MILKVYNYAAGIVTSNFIKTIEGFQGMVFSLSVFLVKPHIQKCFYYIAKTIVKQESFLSPWLAATVGHRSSAGYEIVPAKNADHGKPCPK